MKKYFSLVLSLTASAILITSCQSDNHEGVSSITQAKPVAFADVPDEVVESEPTGNVIDGNKKELREVVRKQQTLNPVQLVDGSFSDVIYPGSVLRGDAFMNGEYTPIVLKNPQEITISANLRGADLPVSSKVIPTLSAIRQTTNNLLYPKVGEVDFANAAAHTSLDATEITTRESFNKGFKTHASGSFLKNMLSFDYKYEKRNHKSNETHYVLVKLRQQFFNISMDPQLIDKWGELSDVGEYEPVYISSVDYGRVVHLLIETQESTDSIRKMIKGGIEAKFVNWGAKVETEYSKQWNKYFKSNKIQLRVAGGPSVNVGKIKSYEDFMEAISVPTSATLIKSSVPISYRVRSLRTNREIEVKNFYTEERFVPEKR